MNNKKVFKPIKGFPDYEIANDGTIRSIDRTIVVNNNGRCVERRLKGQILKPHFHPKRNGLIVSLYLDQEKYYEYVHILVAQVYLNYKKTDNIRLTFKDGNSKNCTATNLTTYETNRSN